MLVCNIISDVYCPYELRKLVNDIQEEIVKWLEFVKPKCQILNSIQKCQLGFKIPS